MKMGSEGGVIINLCGKAGVTTDSPNQAMVGAANAGILGFSRECAREFATYQIRVHAVTVADDDSLDYMAQIAQETVILCNDTSNTILHAIDV